MVDFSLIEDNALKKDIMKAFSKHEHLWNGRLGASKARHHTTDFLDRTRPICQKLYPAGQNSREMLCQNINMRLKDGVINSA